MVQNYVDEVVVVGTFPLFSVSCIDMVELMTVKLSLQLCLGYSVSRVSVFSDVQDKVNPC